MALPKPASTSDSTRPNWLAFLRFAVVFVTLACNFALSTPDLVLPWQPFGSFGFDGSPGGRIGHVYPNLPAGRAGIHAGDIVVGASANIGERADQSYAAAPVGTPSAFRILTPAGTIRSVRLVAQAFPRSWFDNVSDELLILAIVAGALIAALLLLLRPSLVTWAFYAYIVGTIYLGSWVSEFFSATAFAAGLTYATALSPIAYCGIVVFALAFPQHPMIGWRRVTAIVAAVPAAIVALAGIVVNLGYAAHPTAFAPAAEVSATVSGILDIAYTVAAVIVFLVGYAGSDAASRTRSRWLIVGAIAGTAGSTIVTFTQTVPAIAVSPSIGAVNILTALNVLLPIAVAYAIFKHRVIDVRFVLNRALVYATLTSLAIVALVLIEYVVSGFLQQFHFALLIGLAGAVLIGLGIDRVQKVIDAIVDRYVFRSLHAAEERLARIGEAMAFARSTAVVDRMLIDEARDALHLDSVAVVADPDDEDPFVLQLRAEKEPLTRADFLAVPMLVRHHMIGYVLYGHHADGSAIDPTERRMLEHLTHSAAVAYLNIASETRAAEVGELQHAIDLLEVEVRVLHAQRGSR